MKKSLIEKLYCLSFSLRQDPEIVIANITDTFRLAMNLKKVLVHERIPQGFRMVASSPVPGLAYADLCGIKNRLNFDIVNLNEEKVGDLCIIPQGKNPLSVKQCDLVSAFTVQLAGLLEQLSSRIADQQTSMIAEINRYKDLVARDKLTGLYNPSFPFPGLKSRTSRFNGQLSLPLSYFFRSRTGTFCFR